MAPFLLVVIVIGLPLLLWWLLIEKKRREGLLALAEKYNLEINPSRPIAPDPGIRGWIFSATYKRYMQGRIRGLAVVAFDYNIGFGRGRQSGSGVGVQRNVRDAAAISRKLAPARVDGWTFLYSWPFFVKTHRLDANDIERLWDQLLVAPADGIERASFGEDVPGGIVIRPVRMHRNSTS